MEKLAPDFKLQNSEGQWKTLAEYLSSGPVMLVFYPGDFTPVCTAQLCSYRDSWDGFKRLGVQVVGISQDPPEKHKRFEGANEFSFPLLSDPKGEAAKAFGLGKSLGIFPPRANVLVSKDRKILYQHVESLPFFRRKPRELFEVIEGLKAQKAL